MKAPILCRILAILGLIVDGPSSTLADVGGREMSVELGVSQHNLSLHGTRRQ
jgi:hypothetical protein